MTRKEFAKLLREYKLITISARMESLINMSRLHVVEADKICNRTLKAIEEYKKVVKQNRN